MAKNRHKPAKFIRKIDFPYNNFPKKAISSKNAPNFILFSRLRRYPAATPQQGGGCFSGFWNSGILPLYLSLVPKVGTLRGT